ncbi:hypothetical protein BT63DRAFT_456762 [Microthyrium microscopicum]|uniref:Uncharacterized protein n=1 Tax=Microthyrium microscopicum TaxID=703497 RepID=A0A6A6U747_9PEZI|nr:hypothetical protein BT63DRAFT_456762 [Microthyrium microscopicum]
MSNWAAAFSEGGAEEDGLEEDEVWESTECDACGSFDSDLYYCLSCVQTLCDTCWEEVPAHGRNKSRFRFPNINGMKHEKTPHHVLKAIQPAFFTPPNDASYEAMLKEDDQASWFGVRREEDEKLPILLQDHGRFPELMAASSIDSRKKFMQQGKGPTRVVKRTPILVSFVGQTGAGKSTLIRLLIGLKLDHKTSNGVRPQLPVIGSAISDIATSSDVHLYPDPATIQTENPILYADSEGLDGGERLSLSASFRSLSTSDSIAPPFVSEGSFRAAFCSERELVWSDDPSRRTRDFIVAQLYSRLLFTFSDVIVFVQRNARVIEGVIETMVEWAAAALETAYNQPILPYAVVALNATDESTPEELWDVNVSTSAILSSFSGILYKNLVFKRHVKLWADRGKIVTTLDELLGCYFSKVQIIRIPTSQSPNLMYKQGHQLYSEISAAGSLAQVRKSHLRMLLNSRQLQAYLDRAFDHYSRTLEHPFDFVQASFLNSPVPNNLGDNILEFAIALMNHQIEEKQPRVGKEIFEKLSPLIASCIMIDAIRHSVLGTADRIFPENMRATAIIYRCNNTRIGHTSKGHQLQSGIIFKHGEYFSNITFANYRDTFHSLVFMHLSDILSKLGSNSDDSLLQQARAHRLHSDVLKSFYSTYKSAETLGIPSHNICLGCLSGSPEHVLSCEDVLCSACIEAYGRPQGRNAYVLETCPIGFQHESTIEPQYICSKPKNAGVRLLSLEDGALHSITQLEVLRRVELELLGKISVRSLFDMISANGMASIIALAIATQEWSLDECASKFLDIATQSFSQSNLRKTRKLLGVNKGALAAKYRSSSLESSLQKAFDSDAVLFGPESRCLGNTSIPKVMITSESADGGTTVFTNYHRGNSKSLPYKVVRPNSVKGEMKIWEVARASLTFSGHFKPFKHDATERTYTGHGGYPSDPIEVMQHESERLWPSPTSTFPDAVLSIGTGTGLNNSKFKFSKEATERMMWKPARAATSEKPEEEPHDSAWNQFLGTLPPNYPSSKYSRLDVQIPHILPEKDDVSALLAFQKTVRANIRQEEIREIAMKLLAALFYFERTGIIDEVSDEEFYIYGEIHCRLPNGRSEVKQLADLLTDKKFDNPAFIFQETHGPEQCFPIPSCSLDDMQRSCRFRLPGIRIRLSRSMAEVDAVLRVTPEEKFSISGFPRVMQETE